MAIVISTEDDILMIERTQLIFIFNGRHYFYLVLKKEPIVTLSTCDGEYFPTASFVCHAIC